MRRLLLVSVLLGFFSCNSILSKDIVAGENYTEIEVTDGGTIVGEVKYMGDPAVLSLNLPGAWELPGISKTVSEKLVVNKINKGLRYTVVSITGITKGKKREIPFIHPIIDQQRNTYIPRVTAISAGTTVDILNGDEELHTIHTRSVRNQPFNHGMAYKQRIPKRFDYPETIKLFCDIHKDSYAWIIILEHPYFAVTDNHGYFQICDIPPGVYTIKTWHEELGNLEKEVTVKPKEITHVEFTYSQD
ncbi:MAG: hypothetical protein E3K32_14145 [wastewater metagenome]|nr:hypothetical protein [Candidatus Loosdrechtia aerotolerans]